MHAYIVQHIDLEIAYKKSESVIFQSLLLTDSYKIESNRIKREKEKNTSPSPFPITVLLMYPAVLEGYLLHQNYPHYRASEVLAYNLYTKQTLGLPPDYPPHSLLSFNSLLTHTIGHVFCLVEKKRPRKNSHKPAQFCHDLSQILPVPILLVQQLGTLVLKMIIQ